MQRQTQTQDNPTSPHWTQHPQTVSLKKPLTFFFFLSWFTWGVCYRNGERPDTAGLGSLAKLNVLEMATSLWGQDIQASRKYTSLSITHASFRLRQRHAEGRGTLAPDYTGLGLSCHSFHSSSSWVAPSLWLPLKDVWPFLSSTDLQWIRYLELRNEALFTSSWLKPLSLSLFCILLIWSEAMPWNQTH